MGWAVGYDTTWRRDVGYGVPATCDRPGCAEKINRGLAYVCGNEPFGGLTGCGLYFCLPDGGGQDECTHVFKDDPDYRPSPDTTEWISWKLTDQSWQRWRDENPDEVADLAAELARRRP